jgi:hypothetical protein
LRCFYIEVDDPSDLKPGWYFWLLDQTYEIISEPVGPFDDVDDAFRSGKVVVASIVERPPQHRWDYDTP